MEKAERSHGEGFGLSDQLYIGLMQAYVPVQSLPVCGNMACMLIAVLVELRRRRCTRSSLLLGSTLGAPLPGQLAWDAAGECIA